MSAIEMELSALEAEHATAVASLEAATNSAAQSTHNLDEARARRDEIATRLTPLQQLVQQLKNCANSIDQEREAASRELRELKKLRDDVYPVVSEKVDEEKVQALESAESELRKSEKDVLELQEQITELETSWKTAQSDVIAAEQRFRDESAALADLPIQISLGRQHITTLMTSVRNAFVDDLPGEAFLGLRDLDPKGSALAKLIEKQTQLDLEAKIEDERSAIAAASQLSTELTEELAELHKTLSGLQNITEHKRQAVQDRRAEIAAESAPR